MNKEQLKDYLSSSYQGWEVLLNRVIFQIFGEEDFESAFITVPEVFFPFVLTTISTNSVRISSILSEPEGSKSILFKPLHHIADLSCT